MDGNLSTMHEVSTYLTFYMKGS